MKNSVFAEVRYWSGSGSSDYIDDNGNWYNGVAPNFGDSLSFNNTTSRHWAINNKGDSSYFDQIVTYNGAGGINWKGDETSANKFENNNDSELFHIETNIKNRAFPDTDIELNPVGTGGIKVTGTVTITGGKQIKVYGNYTLTLDGVVSGGGASLAIQNSATVILSGANIYTGNTWGNAGTLVINGNQSSATGDVSIGANGKLGGYGTVGGATTISGTHDVSNSGSDRTQNFSSNLTYNGGSIFNWDLDSATNSYDKVVVGGALTKGTGTEPTIFQITLGSGSSFSDEFWNSPQSWTDVFTSGAESATLQLIFTEFRGENVSPTGLVDNRGHFGFSGNTLNWTAVPEPTSALAGLLLAAGLLRRNRRM